MADSNSPVIPGKRPGVYSRDKWYDREKWRSLCERAGMNPNSAPPPPFEEPTNVNSELTRVLKTLLPPESVVESGIAGCWRELVGDTVAEHSRPGRIENKILFVTVKGALWYSQLCRLGTAVILKNIQAKFGADEVRAVKFRPGV